MNEVPRCGAAVRNRSEDLHLPVKDIAANGLTGVRRVSQQEGPKLPMALASRVEREAG
ncbi:hypothetical protein [Pelomonas cellulosilytica]|uniref:Uncharacterized protein n=1 Tax=Pelomonas cellulosilytica TaxID=2906762 RepID=A0ABS8XZU2_9BURK|nr:hypothetical protein [Pelomonas sp. P8]MCE4554925.1 hypothetical protein [Pelomonas sp. P8]